jgi:TonB family protein
MFNRIIVEWFNRGKLPATDYRLLSAFQMGLQRYKIYQTVKPFVCLEFQEFHCKFVSEMYHYMAHRIKYRFLHSLFQLFAYLADKSGGWRLFAQPKLILGGLLIGLSVNAVATQPKKSAKAKKPTPATDTIKPVQATKTRPQRHYCYAPALKQSREQIEDTTVYTVVEKMPQFPGGDVGLYVAKNFHYPQTPMCYDGGISGRFVCQFVIEKDGSVSNIHIIKSLDPECDKEIVRVISSMPKWIPCEQNGQKVRVRYTLPISFRLQ